MSNLKATTKPLREPLPGGGKDGTTVVVEPILGGYMSSPPGWLKSKGGRLATVRAMGIGLPRSRWLELPVPAFLITHPTAGKILVDTGFHASVSSKPSANLGPLFSRLAPIKVEPGGDVASRLRAKGIDESEIGTVVMTHLHYDHSSGMTHYPDATFVISEREWEAATTAKRPSKDGYRVAHFDYLFDYRTVDFDGPGVSSYTTFGRTFDLLGDGSIRLAFTPGHTAGHCSVIARLRDRDMVLAADSVYTLDQIEGAHPPHGAFDMHLWKRSVRELSQFKQRYPQSVIVASHDPEAWPTLAERYE